MSDALRSFVLRSRWLCRSLDWLHSQPSRQPDIVSIGALCGWAAFAMFSGFYRRGPLDHAFPALVVALQVLRAWHIASHCWRSVMAVAGFVLWANIVCITIHGVGWPAMLSAGFGMAASELLNVTRFSLWADRLPPEAVRLPGADRPPPGVP